MTHIDTLKNEITALEAQLAQRPDDYDLYDLIGAKYEELVEAEHEILRKKARELGTLTVETLYGSYPGCHVSLNRYSADNSLCVELWNDENGAIARLTVCLSDKSLKEKGDNFSYLDENNCPWGMNFIETYGLGKNTGRIKTSGYCIYSLIEWNMDELKNYE